jgi:glycosyltransferase involved in cell wall biosynthesis
MIPKISLVITFYNRENYLAAAINSVLKQTFTNWELILFDDGSSDRSLSIARNLAAQDERIRVINSTHLGRGWALKEAIASTSGEYLGWVDSDDLLAPTALQETVVLLDDYPSLGMVYTDYLTIDASGKDLGLGSRCQIPYSKERLLIDFMTFHFRLVRRSVYDRLGGIDPHFGTIEDYELCLRLSEVTEVMHLRSPLYRYRLHPESICQQQLQLQVDLQREAINRALIRRGLNERFQLEVQFRPKFVLKPKTSVPSS